MSKLDILRACKQRFILTLIDPSSCPDLLIFFAQAYVPILSNSKNHKGWPGVIGEDVKKHIYDLRNLICQVRRRSL